jgi:hypothetical protein
MTETSVRLQYGGMKFENDVVDEHMIPGVVASMADNHGIDMGDLPKTALIGSHVATGRVRLTRARATFRVVRYE